MAYQNTATKKIKAREWYLLNRDRILAARKKSYAADPLKFKLARANSRADPVKRAHKNACDREYRKKHPERIREFWDLWAKNNPDKAKETRRRAWQTYALRHPDRIKRKNDRLNPLMDRRKYTIAESSRKAMQEAVELNQALIKLAGAT